MDEQNIVYLENKLSSDNEDSLTFPSRVCLFLLRALHNDLRDGSTALKPICVSPSSAAKGCLGIFKPTDRLPISHVKSDNCPRSIRCVNLPVFVSNNGRLIHCGLSSVLRKMVKQLHLRNPSKKIVTLLGHHEMCLRSCAEVSVWTKFCEVEMPQMLERLQTVDSIGKRNSSKDRKSIIVPEELLKLEDHLRKPAVITQITKKKKKIYEHITNRDRFLQRNKSEETWIDTLNLLSVTNFLEKLYHEESEMHKTICKELRNASKVVSRDVEIPGLGHDFAEGAEVTLTDLVLLPSLCFVLDYFDVHGALQDLIDQVPKVVSWYQRLTSVTVITQALKAAGIPAVILGANRQSCEEPHIRRENGSLVKHRVKVPTSEAGLVLSKLQKSGVDVTTTIDELDTAPLDWNTLPSSVHPEEGSLPSKRIARKCEQLESLATAVLSLASPGDVIVDFCAGGGHLGILLGHLLPQCEVLLIENKEESIRRAMDRVLKLGLTNVTLYQSNLDYFHGAFDIGTCLHACGVATDLVLHQCLRASASFVICPCCYGAVEKTQDFTYPQSKTYRTRLTYEDYSLLAHAADDKLTGKQFMVAVDRDRQELACEHAYCVSLQSLSPLTCSPKNNLLVGKCNK